MLKVEATASSAVVGWRLFRTGATALAIQRYGS